MRCIESSHPQGSAEWMAERLGRLTGSIAAGVAGASTERAAIALACERIAGPAQSWDTPDTLRGREREPYGRMAYEERTKAIVREVGFIRLPTIMAGCSPDGLVDDDGMVEIKSPRREVHATYCITDDLPGDYLWQVTHNLWVTGRKWCDFISYCPDLPRGLDLLVVRYTPDRAWMDRYEELALRFLAKVSYIEARLRERIE